jgi:hypothetical protein
MYLDDATRKAVARAYEKGLFVAPSLEPPKADPNIERRKRNRRDYLRRKKERMEAAGGTPQTIE